MSKSRKIIPIVVIAIGLLLATGISCQPCSCLDWNPVTVSWTGSSPETWTGDYGSTVPISWVSPGTAVSINSSISCSEGCQPSYTWEVTKSAGSPEEPRTGVGLPASFSPASAGSFTAVLNASCDGASCPPATTYIRIDKIQVAPCSCQWDAVEVSWPEGTGFATCGAASTVGPIVLPPETAINISFNVSCLPIPDCLLGDYDWTVTSPLGDSVPTYEQPSTLPWYEFSFTPTTSGSYDVNLEATCNVTPCQCNFQVLVQQETLTLSACVCDDFGAPEESPAPSTALLNWIADNYVGPTGSRNCDDTSMDGYWAHTFLSLAPVAGCQIESATLAIIINNNDSAFENDTMTLGFIKNNDSLWAWSRYLGPPFTPNLDIDLRDTEIIVLDLAAEGLLDGLTSNGFLDVAVEDDSGVDCATLEIVYALQ